MGRKSMLIQDRFWIKVIKTEGCWLWNRSKSMGGYGRFEFKKEQYAHRVAWTITYGAIPIGMCVLHQCDNPACVRPDHLFLGTKQENNTDRTLKGRSASGNKNGMRTHAGLMQGEKNPRAKLNAVNVKEARIKAQQGVGVASLAREYGVDKSTMQDAVSGQTWRHI